jgi:hypothetical protein
MAQHKKEKSQSPHKYHEQADISSPSRLFSRRFLSQIELASLTAGSVAAQATYVSEIDRLNIVPEVDMEVRMSSCYSVLAIYLKSFCSGPMVP